MINKLKQTLKNNYVNYRGWSTKRKILVIESDDWGSIKMPSIEVYNKLLLRGVPVDKNYFTKYDCLESEKDLSDLFELLTGFRDVNGNYLCITANAILANPDFNKINNNGFSKYEYELFTETYKRYQQVNALSFWEEGVKSRILYPQFHGREHINPIEWMKVLNTRDETEILAFENEVLLGIENKNGSKRYLNYTSAFNYESELEQDSFVEVISEGISFFQNIFGFTSKSFVPPCGIKGHNLDKVLFENGIQYLQSGRLFIPDGNGGVKPENYFFGDRNNFGQIYWRRNGTFEPSRDWNFNWEDSVMQEAEYAFRWGKPLVLNSHRVNYVGGIIPKNRENTLRLLSKIIKRLQSKYPDLEFMSSDKLGDIMANSN